MECVYIYTTRDAIFSSSVYERRYSFTGISNKALAGPPVLNRRRSLTEWVGLKVQLVCTRYQHRLFIICTCIIELIAMFVIIYRTVKYNSFYYYSNYP